MKRSLLRYLSGVVLLAMPFALAAQIGAPEQLEGVVAGSAKADALEESPNGIYIIQMVGDPVVAYEGGIKGLRATKPQKGKKINPNSAHVTKYVDYLNGRHAEALSKVGGGQKVYNYQYSFNGFAAKLSHGQAKKMQSVDGVVAVRTDSVGFLDTATTPDFLELTSEGGLWDIGVDGEDVIIGIVDGGIWPESLSFTDRTGSNGNGSKDGKLDYQQIPGWHGKCTPGEAFDASMCNQKLIGAQYYNSGYGGDDGIDTMFPWEFTSARDYGGHGTHTASTAGGNNGTPLTGQAADLLGSVSGIAPRARIAAYKVCWETRAPGGCWQSDSVAAIDQAVADGVDVINFSISGSRTNFFDSVELAFLFAADAGVFIAASAGNSGPAASTVAHPSPWLTTVAASTHDRNYSADTTLGNDATYTGASTNATGAGPADLVYSANVGLAGEDAEEVRLCYPGTLDPAMVTGKIVLCDRGTIARVDKSLAVFQAGGVGAYLANANDGDSLNADLHSVPTIHVNRADGDAIRTYATTDPAPTAVIDESYFDPAPAPFIADFSSRGPLLAGDGDLLKPDVSAPGQDILAAVAPPGNDGEDFAAYSGTSMSSPHVAGLGALLTQLHPGWSPMMIKSALMTTGYDLLPGADPFDQGAGHVDPNSAADPGLVYNSGWNDWLNFLFGDIDQSDLNVPSIAIGILPGSQTVTRTVTNVGDANETYEFSHSMSGVDVVANPSSFTIAPEQSVSFDLTFTSTGAPFNAYATGFIYWTGDLGHVVRSPVAVRPTAVSAPAVVDGAVDGDGDGSVDIPVDFFYSGTYNAALEGIAEEFTWLYDNVSDPDDTQDIFCAGITADLTHLRVATRDADVSNPGDDDLDLRVFYNTACSLSGLVLVGSSGGITSEEVIDVPNAPAGVYVIVVDYYSSPTGSIDYGLNLNIVLGDESNGFVSSAPAAAVDGTSDTVTVDYAVNPAGHHLGVVIHENAGGEVGRTVIAIDP